MARGRPRKNPQDVLIKSAELIGWALGGIEREIVETRKRLAALTAQPGTYTLTLTAAGSSILDLALNPLAGDASSLGMSSTEPPHLNPLPMGKG